MTRDEIRAEWQRIQAAHDEAIGQLRAARIAREAAWKTLDDAMVSAIEANRAAIRLLDRIRDEDSNGQ